MITATDTAWTNPFVTNDAFPVGAAAPLRRNIRSYIVRRVLHLFGVPNHPENARHLIADGGHTR